MRIAVTGCAGQVASSLIERGRASGCEVVALGRPALDLAAPQTIAPALAAAAPDVVVSAAAYTAVDQAEAEPELAHAINAQGARAVAEAARAMGAPLIHLSTDYVFSGALDRPYVESDAAGPLCVFGASKLAGEREVLRVYSANSAILRLSWVHSPFGGNFVKTMLRLGAERGEVAAAADQAGSPTSALDIADGVLQVARGLARDRAASLRGIFHMAASGGASRADFAEAIFAAAVAAGGPAARVRRVTAADFPAAARRPANSRLDCRLIAEVHGVVLPPWRDSLAPVVARLVDDGDYRMRAERLGT